jgi:predicted RNA-binding protein with TRAM domain
LTSLTAGDESIRVNFTSGADGGNAVSSFDYSLDGGLSWSDSGGAGSATSFTITTGLVNGVSYSVQIRAVNDAGPGSGSNTELALPITIADAPTQLVASYGDSSALVAYLSGDNGGSVVTGIEYSLNNGVNWTAVNSLSIANPLALSNLVNGRAYQLRIREVTSQGPGRMSAVLPLTVPLPRVEMPGTTLVVGSTSIVDGTGFAPNSDIRIEMHSTTIELGTVRSDPTGSFRTTISIPNSSAAGNHHLVFVYVTSGQAVDSIPFTVALPSALSSTGVNATQTGSLALAALLAMLCGLSLVSLRRTTPTP